MVLAIRLASCPSLTASAARLAQGPTELAPALPQCCSWPRGISCSPWRTTRCLARLWTGVGGRGARSGYSGVNIPHWVAGDVSFLWVRVKPGSGYTSCLWAVPRVGAGRDSRTVTWAWVCTVALRWTCSEYCLSGHPCLRVWVTRVSLRLGCRRGLQHWALQSPGLDPGICCKGHGPTLAGGATSHHPGWRCPGSGCGLDLSPGSEGWAPMPSV